MRINLGFCSCGLCLFADVFMPSGEVLYLEGDAIVPWSVEHHVIELRLGGGQVITVRETSVGVGPRNKPVMQYVSGCGTACSDFLTGPCEECQAPKGPVIIPDNARRAAQAWYKDAIATASGKKPRPSHKPSAPVLEEDSNVVPFEKWREKGPRRKNGRQEADASRDAPDHKRDRGQLGKPSHIRNAGRPAGQPRLGRGR